MPHEGAVTYDHATVFDSCDLATMFGAICLEHGFTDPDTDHWREEFTALIDGDVYEAITAREGGRTVGFIDGFIVYEPGTRGVELSIRHVYVAPEYREAGIGARLYAEIVRHGLARGIETVVIPVNPPDKIEEIATKVHEQVTGVPMTLRLKMYEGKF